MKQFVKIVGAALALIMCMPAMAILVAPGQDAASVAWGQSIDPLAFGIGFDINGNAVRGGSGTLIENSAEHGAWVAITKHQYSQFNFAQLAFGFGGDSFAAYGAGDYYFTDLVIEHPDLDVAIVRLEALVPGIEAMPLYNGLFQDDTEIVVAGYGDHGNLSQSHPDGTGLWDGLGRAAYGWDFRDGNVFGEPETRYWRADNGLPGYGMGAPGDSGGMVAMEVNDILYWAGIITHGRGTGVSTWGGYTYLSSDLNTWIDDTIDANSPLAPVPEPATATLFLVGASIALIKRRKR